MVALTAFALMSATPTLKADETPDKPAKITKKVVDKPTTEEEVDPTEPTEEAKLPSGIAVKLTAMSESQINEETHYANFYDPGDAKVANVKVNGETVATFTIKIVDLPGNKKRTATKKATLQGWVKNDQPEREEWADVNELPTPTLAFGWGEVDEDGEKNAVSRLNKSMKPVGEVDPYAKRSKKDKTFDAWEIVLNNEHVPCAYVILNKTVSGGYEFVLWTRRPEIKANAELAKKKDAANLTDGGK